MERNTHFLSSQKGSLCRASFFCDIIFENDEVLNLTTAFLNGVLINKFFFRVGKMLLTESTNIL